MHPSCKAPNAGVEPAPPRRSPVAPSRASTGHRSGCRARRAPRTPIRRGEDAQRLGFVQEGARKFWYVARGARLQSNPDQATKVPPGGKARSRAERPSPSAEPRRAELRRAELPSPSPPRARCAASRQPRASGGAGAAGRSCSADSKRAALRPGVTARRRHLSGSRRSAAQLGPTDAQRAAPAHRADRAERAERAELQQTQQPSSRARRMRACEQPSSAAARRAALG